MGGWGGSGVVMWIQIRDCICLVDKFVVGQIVAMERKIDPRLHLAKSWSVSDDPPKVDTRAGGGNTLTAKRTSLPAHDISS